MPRFRHKDPMPHLEDHEFDADDNPDPSRFEEVPAAKPAKATPQTEES